MEIVEPRYKNDLEDRFLKFAKDVREYVKRLPKTMTNFEYAKQLIRSSGSVGANYIESREALGTKDQRMRIRISRKEAKESRYWLELTEPTSENEFERARLKDEATQFIRIFTAILTKLL